MKSHLTLYAIQRLNPFIFVYVKIENCHHNVNLCIFIISDGTSIGISSDGTITSISDIEDASRGFKPG